MHADDKQMGIQIAITILILIGVMTGLIIAANLIT